MAVKIPSQNKKAFEDVMDALGGDDYSYYLFDVTKVEQKDSKKKVQIALKILVPQVKRAKATQDIMGALKKKGYAIEEKSNEINVPIPKQKNQFIRISIKPENSKGSGGGAAATKIQETAQCVYAAMRYYCGDVKNFTIDDFKCGMRHTDAPGVKIEEIMDMSKEWKESSWAGANEIYKKIGGTGWKFVRGDAMIDDGAVKDAFNRVKKQTRLSSEDKWNPADIWMVKDVRKVKQHLDKEVTIDCLNNALQQLRADNELVGISLKKIESSPKMTLKNGEDAMTRRKNEKAKFAKYDLTFDNGRRSDNHPMDVYLYYGEGTFEKFQARNFGGASKGDWKLELKGKSAAQGKIQGQVLRDLISDIIGNGPVPEEAEWNTCKGNEYDKEIFDLLKKYDAKGFNEETAMDYITDAPQPWKYSKLSGLRLLDWLSKHKKKDQIMKEIYLYASSQSDKSSVYWKLQ
tara:strand:+ start:271 stop:1650 length:1380 start_codon:yes stop_codon:yes gene_type:complete